MFLCIYLRNFIYKHLSVTCVLVYWGTFRNAATPHHNLFCYESESEVGQSCPTFCDPVDYSPPGSSVHGILPARILEWVAISYSRGSSQLRDRTQVFCIASRLFKLWATREALFAIGENKFVLFCFNVKAVWMKSFQNEWVMVISVLTMPFLRGLASWLSNKLSNGFCSDLWVRFPSLVHKVKGLDF